MTARRSHRGFAPLSTGSPAYAVVRAKAETVEQGRPGLIFRVDAQTTVSASGAFLAPDGQPDHVRTGFYDVPPKGKRDRESGRFTLTRSGRIVRAREVGRFETFEQAAGALRRMGRAWDGVSLVAVMRATVEAEARKTEWADERARLLAEVDERLKPLADAKNAAAAHLVEAKAKVLADRNSSIWISEVLK